MRNLIWLALLLALSVGQTHAEMLELVNGDRLSGEVIERTEGRIVLQHAVLGRVTVPIAQLEPPKPAAPGLFGTPFLRGWKRSVEMGVSGANGNSQAKDLRTGVDLGYEDENRRWSFEARYLFTEREYETSQHNFRAILNRDFLWPDSRWFLFAGGQYEWDALESWKHRLILGGGPGYDLVSSKSFDLRGRIGPNVIIRRGGDDDVSGELLLGLEAVWRISEAQILKVGNTLFPELSDPGEFRIVSNADWIVQLSERYPIALKLGIENEYESQVDRDTESNDLKYYGSLLYSFLAITSERALAGAGDRNARLR